jgi:hypothetical protein
MAYTTPTTRSTSDLITASIWNTDIVNNIKALKDPPSSQYVVNEGSDYTTSSTSFTAVDGTNLSLTITTVGGAVLVHFHGTVDGAKAYFDVDVDSGGGTAGDDGICVGEFGSAAVPCTFTRRITGLSAASHTFELQWKVASGTATLYAGAGTSTWDVHPQMWVVEIT